MIVCQTNQANVEEEEKRLYPDMQALRELSSFHFFQKIELLDDTRSKK
jgi:hypothetical protein